MSGKTIFKDFYWHNNMNSPLENDISEDGKSLIVKTKKNTDFWRGTWYNFIRHSGHLFGKNLYEDFVMEACIEGNFTTQYDQAGLMIYDTDTTWLKAGIEINDGVPMISSVLTKENSDWAAGVFQGNPKRFWLRLTLVGEVLCVKYSVDSEKWILLRLCTFAKRRERFVAGVYCCSPEREGLEVKFSDVTIKPPPRDILHSN